jgi:hypothetical protein
MGFFSIFRNKMSEDKTRLSFQLDTKDKEVIEDLAKKEGVSVSEWIRHRLTSSLTIRERAMVGGGSGALIPVEESAGNGYDGVQMIPGILPLPPAPKPPPTPANPRRRVYTSGEPTVPGHPCVWLSGFKPNNLQSSCVGTCRHPDQDGRICFWNAGVAKQCPRFEAKRKENIPLGHRPG